MQFTQMASGDTTEDEVAVNENNQGLKESQEPWSGGETESEEEVEEQQEELKECQDCRADIKLMNEIQYKLHTWEAEIRELKRTICRTIIKRERKFRDPAAEFERFSKKQRLKAKKLLAKVRKIEAIHGKVVEEEEKK